MRHFGVPARLVQGFLPGERDERTGLETVRFSDSHAWVEVYFPGYGWVDFDPTGGNLAQQAADPGRPAPPDSLEPAHRQPRRRRTRWAAHQSRPRRGSFRQRGLRRHERFRRDRQPGVHRDRVPPRPRDRSASPSSRTSAAPGEQRSRKRRIAALPGSPGGSGSGPSPRRRYSSTRTHSASSCRSPGRTSRSWRTPRSKWHTGGARSEVTACGGFGRPTGGSGSRSSVSRSGAASGGVDAPSDRYIAPDRSRASEVSSARSSRMGARCSVRLWARRLARPPRNSTTLIPHNANGKAQKRSSGSSRSARSTTLKTPSWATRIDHGWSGRVGSRRPEHGRAIERTGRPGRSEWREKRRERGPGASVRRRSPIRRPVPRPRGAVGATPRGRRRSARRHRRGEVPPIRPGRSRRTRDPGASSLRPDPPIGRRDGGVDGGRRLRRPAQRRMDDLDRGDAPAVAGPATPSAAPAGPPPARPAATRRPRAASPPAPGNGPRR